MEKGMERGVVCVTGGTGYVASWLIMRLLQHGYAVNTTIRSHPDQNKDISYLTNLPGASERLRFFTADLDKPESFNDSIKGCVGVFHVAHSIDFEGKEDEETNTKRSINATICILQACLNSKSVRRVVYTSSASAITFSGKDSSVLDESSWTGVNFVRSLKTSWGPYFISKTLTERAALEFAETNGLDLVTVVPTFIHGPFITPHCPGSVRTSMSVIFDDENQLKSSTTTMSFVHMDDVATAHIFLLEYPNAKGRYICSAVDITVDELQIFLSERYPEYNVSSTSFLELKDSKKIQVLSKKLLETGIEYKYGLNKCMMMQLNAAKRRVFSKTYVQRSSYIFIIFIIENMGSYPTSFDMHISPFRSIFHSYYVSF